MFWSDVNHSLEYIAGALGTIKAGNTIVSSEYENWEDIQKVLKQSEADVLVVSPFVQSEKNKTRMDKLNEAIPELQSSKFI
jgi:replicative DNA helicase